MPGEMCWGNSKVNSKVTTFWSRFHRTYVKCTKVNSPVPNSKIQQRIGIFHFVPQLSGSCSHLVRSWDIKKDNTGLALLIWWSWCEGRCVGTLLCSWLWGADWWLGRLGIPIPTLTPQHTTGKTLLFFLMDHLSRLFGRNHFSDSFYLWPRDMNHYE